MFEKLDNELKAIVDNDYFYDYGYSLVEGTLNQFTKSDYEQLLSTLTTKSLRYKEYLAYVITDRDIQISELELVIIEKINGY